MLGLPNELARIPDNEVCLFLPYYKRVKENPAYETELCAEFRVGLSWREQYAGLHKLKAKGHKKQPTVYFIDNEYYFGRDGLYGYLDDGERYAFFSKAVLDAMAVLQFYPDVIQSNDWQTAMVPVYLNAQYRGSSPIPRRSSPSTTLSIRAGPTRTSLTTCWVFRSPSGVSWTSPAAST